MSFTYTPYIFPLIGAALVSLTVAVYAWFRRSTTGALALSLMSIAIFIWEAAYSLEIAGANLETKYVWGTIQYIGIVVSTYSWLLFSIVHSGNTQILSRRFHILTPLIPVITILLALTTKWHGLIWSEYHLDWQGDFFGFGVVYGIWFWVHFVYSYAMLLTGAVFLIRSLINRQGLYRGQVFAMLVAVFAPWVGNFLYFTGNSPIPYLDLTPFALTVTVAALAWAVFGFRLVDIVPLARDRVVETLSDGMIVLDVGNRIVDINPAAARMIGVTAAQVIGASAAEALRPWSHLLDRFRNALDAVERISVGAGETLRYYEIRFSPLLDKQNALVGRVVLLRSLDTDFAASSESFSAESFSEKPVAPDFSPDGITADHENQAIKFRNPVLRGFLSFFNASIKKDLIVPSHIHADWYRGRERTFTILMRVTSVFASLLIGVILLNAAGISIYHVGLLVFCGILWYLGLARRLRFEFRAGVFLSLLFGVTLVEMTVYGYSVDAFTIHMAFVSSAALLTGKRGLSISLLISMATLGVFGWLIGTGILVPLGGLIQPLPLFAITPGSVFDSILTFFASAAGVGVAIAFLLESLDRLRQSESQGLKLLQRERDLLEKRVAERTRDLAEARDQAFVISRQMRKYFRAMQQSGNAIVITDAEGNIEYANPKFTEVSGYTLEEVFGGNLRILKSGNQSPEFYEKLWSTITSGGVWTGVFHNRKKDGTLYWESSTIAPVLDVRGVVTNYVAIKEDVTARRQADEELQRLSLAVEQSGNTVLIMDRNGLIEYVNPKFTEVTGYSAAEAKGKSPIALMNGFEGEPDFSHDEWWLTVNAGGTWHGEFQNHRKDGSLFWESATIAPVHGRNGEIINFMEIKQDITEQKILQEQLQKQNDYLSILHQMTLDLLNRRSLDELLQVIVDRSAILLDAPYVELLLLEGEDLVVHAVTYNASSLLGSHSPRGQGNAVWRAVETRQPFFVEDYSQWAGRRSLYDGIDLRATAAFPILVGDSCLGVLGLGRGTTSYAFSAGQIETGILFTRLVALVLDNAKLYQSAINEITERKRADALLQESEARFRQIVENASDIIYRADADGNFTYLNPAALKIMGYASEQEALGKNYFDLTAPEFRLQLIRMYKKQCADKTRSAYYEIPSLAPDGHMIWVGQNVQLIMEGEQVVGFQAVARNITEIKQAQDALALSRDQALEASRFKSQLLSRVSHELRTPLGGILGYAELLQFNAFGSLAEKQREAVENIIESTNYLTNVVNDLLDESQIESKSLSLHNEYFDPVELLERTNTTMSVLAGKKQLSYIAEAAPDLPMELYGDVNRLQQILINLVGNAIKYTKAGEIHVELNRPNPAHWSIEVRDTGNGIPLDDQRNIFEPFRQVHNSITRENRGSGLGLAITKQLVELMGGQISLESHVGKGSLFTVILPIINAPGE